MKSIWKFQLFPAQPVVYLPRGARVLSAGAQEDNIFVWAAVNPEAEKVPRIIRVYLTGSVIAENLQDLTFVGTVFVGYLVFHVFDGGEATK